jgi:hypothetical protein
MSQAAIINAIFAAVVIVIVVAPLLWAILTQHRDEHRPRLAACGPPARPAAALPAARRPGITRIEGSSAG